MNKKFSLGLKVLSLVLVVSFVLLNLSLEINSNDRDIKVYAFNQKGVLGIRETISRSDLIFQEGESFGFDELMEIKDLTSDIEVQADYFIKIKPDVIKATALSGKAKIVKPTVSPAKQQCVAKLNKLLYNYSGTPWRNLGGVFYDAAVAAGGDCDTARWAIALGGAESALGKKIKPGTYNAWGWAGGSRVLGSNWTQAIYYYTSAAYSRYLSKENFSAYHGAYCPCSDRWENNVRYFLGRMY